MQIITNYMTQTGLYGAGGYINVKGMILHSVGCAVDKAEEWWPRWNKRSFASASVHGFIDDKKAIIALPCMEQKGKAMKGYHVAVNSTHNKYLGFEMCEYGGIGYTGGGSWDHKDIQQVSAYTKAVYPNAVQLFAKLCTFHGLDPLKDGVILSHHEACLRGMACNHGDVEHIWKYIGLTMNQFRKDVKAAMSGNSGATVTTSKPNTASNTLYRVRKSWADAKSQTGAYSSLENAKKSCKPGYSVFDSKGKVVYTAKTTSTPAPSKPAQTQKSELKVDGLWGTDTTKRLQKIFGTAADGIISNQWAMYKSKNKGLTTGWEWHQKPNGQGSQLIRAMQKKFGMPASKCDGEIGTETIKVFQKYFGTVQDGYISSPSGVVKAIQKWANSQK